MKLQQYVRALRGVLEVSVKWWQDYTRETDHLYYYFFTRKSAWFSTITDAFSNGFKTIEKPRRAANKYNVQTRGCVQFFVPHTSYQLSAESRQSNIGNTHYLCHNKNKVHDAC